MTPTSRVPASATLDSGEAKRIAADPDRLGAAFTYWTARFSALGESVLDSGRVSSTALKVAEAIPDEEMSKLLPERQHLFAIEDRTTMVQSGGCLLSVDEIAKFVERTLSVLESTPKTKEEMSRFVARSTGRGSVAAFLQAFREAAAQPPKAIVWDAQDVAQGIVAAREVYDLLRRYEACARNAKEFSLKTSELLAIFRQEGGLIIPPPRDSFPHAPLVPTAARTCRFAEVLFGGDLTVSRPGCNLVYNISGSFTRSVPNVGIGTLDTKDHKASREFNLVRRNLIIVGGLDSICSPRVSPNDELRQLFRMARAAKPLPEPLRVLDSRTRDHLGKDRNQTFIFDEMCIGLMMADVESAEGLSRPPDASALLIALQSSMTTLVDTHIASTPDSKNDIFLLADHGGAETSAILRIQAQWFESRMRLDTLLARSDRRAGAVWPRLSPFLAYLRYNMGDAIFTGMLLRLVIQLEDIAKGAAKRGWHNADAFLTEFARARWKKSDSAGLKKQLTSHFEPNVGTEDAWRHLGLIQAIRAAGVSPGWLRNAVVPVPKLKKTAGVARQLVEVIANSDLLPSLEALLAQTPVSILMSLKITAIKDARAQRAPFVKAHSYDQLRQVYSDAFVEAGVKD